MGEGDKMDGADRTNCADMTSLEALDAMINLSNTVHTTTIFLGILKTIDAILEKNKELEARIVALEKEIDLIRGDGGIVECGICGERDCACIAFGQLIL